MKAILSFLCKIPAAFGTARKRNRVLLFVPVPAKEGREGKGREEGKIEKSAPRLPSVLLSLSLLVPNHGVRRGRHHRIPHPSAPFLIHSPPPTPPLRLPSRRRIQATKRRRGGGEQFRLGLRARAHQSRAVRALHLAALQGCSHGAGARCCHRKRLDNRIWNGGTGSGEQRWWGGQATGVDTPMVALHKITTAPDAGGVHLQRVWPAYHQSHQSSCLHRWNCVCSVLRLQHIPQIGRQLEPVPRDEMLCWSRLPLRRGCSIQLSRQQRGRRHLSPLKPLYAFGT